MGNCQAAEAAAVVVQHPGNGKIERMYWSISANEVMCSNPGHYVALVVVESSNPSTVKHQLKLLKPTDTLHVGQVYRLISFEDVIKEFAGKKSVKLGKLLKESGVLKSDARRSKLDHKQIEHDAPGSVSSISRSSRRVGRHHGGGGQWKPALHSIAEFGS